MSRPIYRCLPNKHTTLTGPTHPCIWVHWICATCPEVCYIHWYLSLCECVFLWGLKLWQYLHQCKHQENNSEHNHWITQDQIQWLSRGLRSTNETITCRQNTQKVQTVHAHKRTPHRTAFNLHYVGRISSLISPISPCWFTPCWSQMRTRMAQQRLPLLIFLLAISVHIIILTNHPPPHSPTYCHHWLGASQLQTSSSWLRLIWVKWVLPCCGLGRDSPTGWKRGRRKTSPS